MMTEMEIRELLADLTYPEKSELYALLLCLERMREPAALRPA